LLFTSLTLPIIIGKWLVDANYDLVRGLVAILVNPMSVKHKSAVHGMSTTVGREESLKDGKLHSPGDISR
jgi:hypothetical protein